MWAGYEVPVQAVEVRVATDADVEALSELAEASDLAAESWETTGDADRLLQRWIEAAPARRGAGTLETVA